MNIRKTLLLILILAVASLGLTGCEQKSEPAPPEHPAAETVTEQANEAVDKAAEATEEAGEAVEEAVEEHPTGEHPQ